MAQTQQHLNLKFRLLTIIVTFLVVKFPKGFLQSLLAVFEPRASMYQGISLLSWGVMRICLFKIKAILFSTQNTNY